MKVFSIAWHTFKEIYQSKVLVNILFLGLFLLLVTYAISEFSYGVADKVTLDIGLGLISLSGVSIAIFLGSRLLVQEIESRTLYLVLVRSVSRMEFLLGKVLGLAGILLVNLLLLFILLMIFYVGLGGSWTPLLGWSVFFIYIESLIVLMMVLFFSLFSNPTIAIMMTLTLFLAGHGADSVKETQLYRSDLALQKFIDFYSLWFPNFNKLNIKSFVLYEKFISQDWLGTASLYSGAWIIFFTAISITLFNKKELT